MNDTFTPPPGLAPKSARTRKPATPKTPRAPRAVDPGIIAIRKEANAKVKEYRRQLGSAGILKTIIEKRLPQLTTADKEKLLDALSNTATPALELPRAELRRAEMV